MEELSLPAISPAKGSFEPGFEPLARCFAEQLQNGEEIGASVAVYHRGRPVVDLWGGKADTELDRDWDAETRIVLFSVTKGFAAMAFHLLADRGLLDWDARVVDYWPEFGRNGKETITVGTLLGHRGGLLYIDQPLSLEDCIDPDKAAKVRDAIESQKPAWQPGEGQGYHALTFGLYATELFRRVAGEEMDTFIRRELLEPLGSDVYMGAPASLDSKFARLYPPKPANRAAKMISSALFRRESTEANVFRGILKPGSMIKKAFLNPSEPSNDMRVYNQPPVRRANLAWGSASGSARGVARAYLPFANGGAHGGRQYLKPETLEPAYQRQGWSMRDEVLQKPVGWSNGFLKEETDLFSPNAESFGHAGMGGALGWADPIENISFGYAMNGMDWRIRSPRAIALCHALYRSRLE